MRYSNARDKSGECFDTLRVLALGIVSNLESPCFLEDFALLPRIEPLQQWMSNSLKKLIQDERTHKSQEPY